MESRMLTKNDIIHIVDEVKNNRSLILSQVEKAMSETIRFSQDAVLALGDASYNEVKDAIVQCFKDEMSKI